MEEQFILDTNILVLAIRDSPIWKTIKTKYALDMDNAYISVVSKAEILSLATQLDWGEEKMSNLIELLKNLEIIPVEAEELINAYVEIDLYSQKRAKGVSYPPNFTPRNMGKNDLWIAATAYVTNSTLLSTDKDFEHLKDLFIHFEYIDITKI